MSTRSPATPSGVGIVSLSLRHWRARHHPLLAWAGYWIVLALVTLRPAIAALWRLTSGPDGHGTVDASVGDGILSLSVKDPGGVGSHGSASAMSIALWFAGAPLLLLLLGLKVWPRATSPALSATSR